MNLPASWDGLTRELDAWAEAGRTATFWWRDDDATRPTGELDRLLGLARDHNLVIALAAIPAEAEADLAQRLKGETSALIFTHGFQHRNHAPAGEKKSEFPLTRPLEAALSDLAAGLRRSAELFGGRARRVLTPPWNRMASTLLPALPALGYRGLSAFGPRTAGAGPHGLAIVNTHLDPIDWRGGQGFLGLAASLALATRHLAERRRGAVDPDEPTGLLSHHLRHDTAGWDFVASFLQRTGEHPAVRWLDPDSAFGAEQTQ